MKKFKKAMACLTAAAMLTGLAGSAGTGMAVTHAAGVEDNLILDFDFENLTAGDTITGGGAKATGTYSLQDSYEGAGKAIYLDGSSQFLTATKEDGSSLLTGLKEMTISFEMKSDRTATNWPFYAAPSTATQPIGGSGKELYFGLLVNGGNITAERYLNGRSTCASTAMNSGWSHVDVVVSEVDTAIYIDGVEKSRVTTSNGLDAILGDSSILQIGKANWGSGEYCKGWIDNMKVYNKALTVEELNQAVPAAYANIVLPQLADTISDVTLDNEKVALPNYDGMVKWKSSMPEIVIGENGLSATVKQPAKGEEAITGKLTAVLSKYGQRFEKEVNVTIKPAVDPDDPYGYLMVHFVEDSAGYQEKIYLDISRGDNPQQWDPLNARNPIMASNLGTTGSRDPFITYNPENETYYIIATDLRVFGGDGGGWGVWQDHYSTKMNVWESKDLIHWSDVRQYDVALNSEGEKEDTYMGMMWAPEATWVDDYYGEGKGAFVVYWSSMTSSGYSKIMWGATTDFTQDTYEFGGVLIDPGHTVIDTTILQAGEKTYHITKDNAKGKELYMQVTTDKEWWKPDTTWTTVQTNIGQSRFGAVEGPATFVDHSNENSFYLFVDDLPTPGYQPMYTSDPDKGWEYLDSSDYYLTSMTKHGGVISLTKAQYDALRNADAISAVSDDLGKVIVVEGQTEAELNKVLPETAEVNLAYNMGISSLPVEWDTSAVNMSEAGSYKVTGVVQSIGANKNQWVGKDNSTSYLAEDKQLYSSVAITVTATVEVKDASAAAVTSLTVTAPNKTEYKKGEDLDLTGLKVVVKYADDTEQVITDGYEVSGYDASKDGEQTVTVSFGGQEATFTVTVLGLPYVDVSETDWFYNAVYYNYCEKTMTGLDETHFGPNAPLARAQFALILYRMEGTPGVAYEAIFPDVEEGVWYTSAILWAAANDIVTGYTSTGMFGPSDKINREQMAVMMYRYANFKEYNTDDKADFSKFADADKVSAYATEAMKWAVGTGIISGKNNGTVIDPQGDATRAECATIIMRFMEKYN